MARRIDLYQKEDVQVAVGLTVADVEDILTRTPVSSRYRVQLEEAIRVDAALGYWPEEAITTFVMEDFAEAYDLYGDGDLESAIARAVRRHLADALCAGDWDLALAVALRDE